MAGAYKVHGKAHGGVWESSWKNSWQKVHGKKFMAKSSWRGPRIMHVALPLQT